MLSGIVVAKLAAEALKAVNYILVESAGGFFKEAGSQLLVFVKSKFQPMINFNKAEQERKKLTQSEQALFLDSVKALAINDLSFQEELEKLITEFQRSVPESGVAYNNLNSSNNQFLSKETNIQENYGVGTNLGGNVSIDNRKFRES